MNVYERSHFSLAARTFHSILLLSLILSIAAIAFGYTLYALSVERQYTTKLSDIALTGAALVDRDALAPLSERIMETWRGDPENAPERCRDYKDARYEELAAFLRTVRDGNRLTTTLIALPDDENMNLIFLVNPDEAFAAYEPGRTILLDQEHLSSYEMKDGRPNGVILRQSDGEYACSAAAPILGAEGRLIGYMICNLLITDVIRSSVGFLWQYVLLLAAVTVIVAVIFVQRMKRTLVRPVNDIASAAENYIKDRREGRRGRTYFDMLNISTGDEIENLSLMMADMEQELTNYEENLTRITAEKERIGAELGVASQIQEGMLPSIFPPFPGRSEFDIYATMHTAKEVGGDFYDFFLIDDDHLAIVMADVSGKGVPAALFMMASKILISNYALMNPDSPAKVLERVNHQICLSNRAEMFVTTWLGFLEISTGRLKAANAGHEYPVLRRAGGRYELYRDKHGFVLGGMDGMRYKEYDLQLGADDVLLLYTDGVTEATDRDNTLFGDQRLLSALNKLPQGNPKDVLDHLKLEIDSFVGDAPQFDDITMLCLRYRGEAMKKLTIEAKIDNLDEVLAFVDGELEAAGCSLKTQMQIDVAVEEIFVNIAHYAYAPDTGKAVIGVEVIGEPPCARITFSDSGMPYNPLEKEDPDVTLSAEERMIGGLGIFMVKKSMDSMDYEYRNGQNLLTMTKKL